MRKHPQDTRIAVLDHVREARILRPSMIFGYQALPWRPYIGAVCTSEDLERFAENFDIQRAGYKYLQTPENSKAQDVIRVDARCKNGKVQKLFAGRYDSIETNKFYGEVPGMREHLGYLKDRFQDFANIVTPAFGTSYRIKIEDRTRRIGRHRDDKPNVMIATLGLDKDFTPTEWENSDGESLSGGRAALTFNTPPLWHWSPDVDKRPVISAATRRPKYG